MNKQPPSRVAGLGAQPAEQFFGRLVAEGLGLTYGDVRLASGYSETPATAGNTVSRFSRRIPLRIPFASAAMDTVTEAKMAIAMALSGGIGVIHKNLTPAEQAKAVSEVKHYVNGLIRTPVTVSPNQKAKDVLENAAAHGHRFRTFPVTSEANALVGLVTNQDFQTAALTEELTIGQIMTTNLMTVPKETGPEEALAKMRAEKKKVLPVVEGEVLVGLYLLSDLERVVNRCGTENLDANGQLFVAAAVGVGKDALERAKILAEAGVNALVIDTAHADTRAAIETVAMLKAQFSLIDVVAGNVSEPESAWRLAEAGADGVKVGQGPGSICTTRKVAGIGNPQVTAVWSCVEALLEFPDVPIIADGGITDSGDAVIALALGAGCVMIGRAFAGCDEAPGEEQVVRGVRYRKYRGMGSLGAMKSNAESRARYGQTNPGQKVVPEGVEALVPAIGPVADRLQQLVGGVRSGMGYVGAPDITTLKAKARFRRLTQAANVESAPHSLSEVTG